MRFFARLFALCLMVLPLPAFAQDKPNVVATFSILGDMTREIAGDRVSVKTLVGPDSDCHEYEPTPDDAKALAKADLVLINGWGLEGWLERLVKASGYLGPVVRTTEGISPLHSTEHHGEEGHHHHHDEGAPDPHAWQSLANGVIYATNIRDALIRIDPASEAAYRANTDAYIKKINALHAWAQKEISAIPQAQRKVISMHDAFHYFTEAYGVDFIAPQGMSTEGQPSAADMARLVDQVRSSHVRAVFLENMTDSRLLKQLEQDAGAQAGGVLYSDALSKADGPAPTYLEMFRHNVTQLAKAMQSGR